MMPLAAPRKAKGSAPAGQRHGRADHTAMHHDRDRWSGCAAAIRSRPDAHPRLQRRSGFRAGDFAPFLACPGALKCGVVLADLDAVKPAIPVAQMHLAQVRIR